MSWLQGGGAGRSMVDMEDGAADGIGDLVRDPDFTFCGFLVIVGILR